MKLSINPDTRRLTLYAPESNIFGSFVPDQNPGSEFRRVSKRNLFTHFF